ncbi:MAG: hypothetical protein ACFFB3_05545 [Candidatus Hodarchaeota archaeon]
MSKKERSSRIWQLVSSERSKSIRSWSLWLIKLMFAVVALYICLFLLQHIGFVLDVESALPSLPLILDPPFPEILTTSELTLSGEAPPNSLIEFRVGSRVIGQVSTGYNGRFTHTLTIPPQANSIQLIAIDGRLRKLGELSVNIKWREGVYKPTIDMAFYISEIKKLWVSGQATPLDNIRLETENGDDLLEFQTSEFGIFDAFISVTSGPPDKVLALVAVDSKNITASDSFPVTIISLKDLPLSREVDLNLSATETEMKIKITLPNAHPLNRALAKGYIPASVFVKMTVGEFPFGFGELPSWLGEFPPWFGERISSLSINESFGIVNFQVSLKAPIHEFYLNEFGKGIASIPLLSAQDRITLHLNEEHLPDWYDDPLPNTLDTKEATWHGPRRALKGRQIIRFGYHLPELLEQIQRKKEARERKAPPSDEEKGQEFIAKFETRVGGNLIKLTWDTFILLIPFIGLFWLAQQYHFGKIEVWQPLVAATIILAVWRSWRFFYSLLIDSQALWIQNIFTPFFFTTARGLKDVYISDIGANAFWLIFVLFVGLAPIYFSRVVRSELGWRSIQTPLPARSLISRITTKTWRGIRLLYGIITLVSLLVFSRMILMPSGLFRELHKFIDEKVKLPLDSPMFPVLSIPLLCLFLFAFGLRTGLFGLGLLAVAVRFISIDKFRLPNELSFMSQIPWWIVLILAGLATYPLIIRLLGMILPFIKEKNFTILRRSVGAGLITISILLHKFPPKLLLIVAGSLIFIGIGWVAFYGLANTRIVMPLAKWARSYQWLFVLILAVLGLIIGWPFVRQGESLHFSNLFQLADKLEALFVYIIALGVVFLLWDHARQNSSVILSLPVLYTGMYFFAVFLINSTATWLFIPIPFIIGFIVVRFWLFKPKGELNKLHLALRNGLRDLKQHIQEVLNVAEAHTNLRAIKKALTGQFEKATLTPSDYEKKLSTYQEYFRKKLKTEEAAGEFSKRTEVFGVGELDVLANTTSALKIGALISLVPFSIALYQYLPTSKVFYPYPWADLLVFFISAAASWLIYVFFFGYFYVHIRGNSGLGKGFHLFLALTIPFALYRVLGTQSFKDMIPFFIWALQILIFCSLLGLLSIDYHILRKNGFSARHLKVVHNLPALSALITTVVAAITSAIVAIIAGRLTDIVNFFLNTILPQAP